MKTILEGSSRRVSTIFHEVDVNFVEVCNSILKIAFPGKILQNYADDDYEPAEPVTDNCYLVKEDGTVWGLEVEKNDIIAWDGAAWEVIPWKITEINDALQFLFFDAEKIALTAVTGLGAVNVQEAIEQITAALIQAGIFIPDIGSGSASV